VNACEYSDCRGEDDCNDDVNVDTTKKVFVCVRVHMDVFVCLSVYMDVCVCQCIMTRDLCVFVFICVRVSV